jgi:hypothetical protein
MASFLVEVYAPATAASAAIERRLRVASAELTRAGTPVRHLRSIFVPEDETCFYLLEAGAVEAVREASVQAGISAARIVEALVGACEAVGSGDRSRSRNSRPATQA